jgi:hypothetical protein
MDVGTSAWLQAPKHCSSDAQLVGRWLLFSLMNRNGSNNTSDLVRSSSSPHQPINKSQQMALLHSRLKTVSGLAPRCSAPLKLLTRIPVCPKRAAPVVAALGSGGGMSTPVQQSPILHGAVQMGSSAVVLASLLLSETGQVNSLPALTLLSS